MASSLFEAQRELVEKELMDRELEIAHDIQSTLIPHEISQPRGYEIEVYYKAAMQVGGDYVDVIPIDATRIALAMADVSGKGIPGLVLMAMLKIMVHELARKGTEPVQVIRQLNVSLAKYVRRNMFVTMFFGVLDTETGNIRCSNAGHNPIMLYHHSAKSSGFHKMKGPPIGLFPDEYFCNQLREYRFKLEPGDVVLQYTDGLPESQDSGGNQFGLEKIISTCEVHGSSGAKALVELLVEAEQEFRGQCPQFDDLTLLAVGAPVIMSAEKALVRLNI